MECNLNPQASMNRLMEQSVWTSTAIFSKSQKMHLGTFANQATI